jgi:outer membrane protein assembly factor BamA
VFEPALVWMFAKQSFATVSARGKFAHTDTGSNVVGGLYGSGDFFQVGPVLGVSIDRRDPGTTPMQGFRADISCSLFPPWATVASAFGEVHGELSYNHPLVSRLSIAARAGGKHVLGDTPYYEAAYIGGASTLRGYPSQRFAGDAAAFGNIELRLPVNVGSFFPRGSLGVFGLCDVGRVFLEGEVSDQWHVAQGGGVWIARPGADNAISFSVAASDEGTRYYVQSRVWF